MNLFFIFLGTLTNVFSTIVAMSKKTKPTVATSPKEEQEKLLPTTETNFTWEKIRQFVFDKV